MDPKDRPKMIGLVSGIVLVFGFGAYQIMGSMGGQAPAPPPVDAAKSAPVSTLTSANPPEEDLIELPTQLLVTNFDPFRKVLNPQAFVPPTDGGEAPSSRRRARPPRMAFGNMLGAALPGVIGDGQNIDPMAIPPPGGEAAPASAEILLEGVISGGAGLAVVKVGGESYVVAPGEKFANGLKVTAITANTATLARGKSRVTLNVGG